MCGLVGIAGQIDRVDVDVFKDLLWIDAIRGQDNTGVAAVYYDTPDKCSVLKVSGGPDQLFERRTLNDVIKVGASVLMGHNRSKTIGDTRWSNAHPFDMTNIVGAHNGTLTYSSKGRMLDERRFDTDSEAMFHTMNQEGIAETIKRMDGAWSLVWYDKRDKTLSFLRNKERPLYWVLDESLSTLYWASQAEMLYLVLNRHGVKLASKCKYTNEDTLVVWQVNDKPEFKLNKPVHTQVKAPPFVYTPPAQPTHQRDMRRAMLERHFPGSTGADVIPLRPGPGEADYAACQFGVGKPIKGVFEKDEDCNLFNELVNKGKLRMDTLQAAGAKAGGSYYVGYDQQRYSRLQFESLMTEACALCPTVPSWGEPLKFLKDGSFLCSECMTGEHNKVEVIKLLGQML